MYLSLNISITQYSQFTSRSRMPHFVLDTIQIPCIETLERINNNKGVLKHTPACSKDP